jgi:alpha-beta hydrolase superfamily lysophospholipase
VATTGPDGDGIPLMLIHGAWLSACSCEHFADYFDKRGFAVSAPEWPRRHGDVEHLREHADELAGLGLTEIVDHYEALIGELDQPPVLIGHSFGGLIVELLLDRGRGRAGRGAQPGVAEGHPRPAVLVAEAASPALAHPSKRRGIVTLTLEELTYGFVNTFAPERPPRRTSATPSPRPAGSSTRRDSPTSRSTRPRTCASRTSSAPRC